MGLVDYEWEIVTADAFLRLRPGSALRLTADASWVVGPRFGSRLDAEKCLAELKAAFKLADEHEEKKSKEKSDGK